MIAIHDNLQRTAKPASPRLSLRSWRSAAARRGFAPLEFVLCLPVLAVAFLVIIWLGRSSSTQSQVVIEARTTSWRERHTGAEGDALQFARARGAVTREANGDASVSPLFQGFARPASSHTVLAGSWDFHQLTEDEMNSQPNWELYRKVGRESAKLLGETFDEGMIDALRIDELNGFDPEQWVGEFMPDELAAVENWLSKGNQAKQNPQLDVEKRKQQEKDKQRAKVDKLERDIAADEMKLTEDERDLANTQFQIWNLTRDGTSNTEAAEVDKLKAHQKALEDKLDAPAEQRAKDVVDQKKELEREKQVLSEVERL